MNTSVQVSDLGKVLRSERVHFNLHAPALVECAVRRGEVRLDARGAVVGYTAPHTGRSPKDKFIVRDEITRDTVDWGAVNQPVEPEIFDALYNRVIDYLHGRREPRCRHAGRSNEWDNLVGSEDTESRWSDTQLPQ